MLKLDEDLERLWADTSHIRREEFYKVQERRNARERAGRFDGEFSFSRAVDGLAGNDLDRLAPFELQGSETIAKEIGRQPTPGHLFVRAQPSQPHRRDLTAANFSGGGALVNTETAPGQVFVDFLFAALLFLRLGITQVNLTGNASFPKLSGAVTPSWLTSEGLAIPETQLTFAAVAATPKSVGAYTEISRQALKQTSPEGQAVAVRNLATATAAEADAKLINGSGAAGQPTGLINTAGIGSVNGASATYGTILDAVKLVEDGNGVIDPGKLGFALSPTDARLLRAREMATGSGMLMTSNTLAGYPVVVSKSVPNGTAVFGDWSQVMLVNWGVLEIGADPYGIASNLFKTGIVGLRSIWTLDVVCLHPESFVKITSIS